MNRTDLAVLSSRLLSIHLLVTAGSFLPQAVGQGAASVAASPMVVMAAAAVVLWIAGPAMLTRGMAAEEPDRSDRPGLREWACLLLRLMGVWLIVLAAGGIAGMLAYAAAADASSPFFDRAIAVDQVADGVVKGVAGLVLVVAGPRLSRALCGRS